jgi:hypothetical protein
MPLIVSKIPEKLNFNLVFQNYCLIACGKGGEITRVRNNPLIYTASSLLLRTKHMVQIGN